MYILAYVYNIFILYNIRIHNYTKNNLHNMWNNARNGGKRLLNGIKFVVYPLAKQCQWWILSCRIFAREYFRVKYFCRIFSEYLHAEYFHEEYFQNIFIRNIFKIFASWIFSEYFHAEYFQNIPTQNNGAAPRVDLDRKICIIFWALRRKTNAKIDRVTRYLYIFIYIHIYTHIYMYIYIYIQIFRNSHSNI